MFNLGGGHICNGIWKKYSVTVCSAYHPTYELYDAPTALNHCTKCNSRWITNGKCDKCGTEMPWLKTDRSYYQFHKRLK